MNSIITTVFGLVSAIGAVVLALGYEDIGAILIGIGGGGVGIAARDNNKTSEQAHAK